MGLPFFKLNCIRNHSCTFSRFLVLLLPKTVIPPPGLYYRPLLLDSFHLWKGKENDFLPCIPSAQHQHLLWGNFWSRWGLAGGQKEGNAALRQHSVQMSNFLPKYSASSHTTKITSLTTCTSSKQANAQKNHVNK